MKRFLIALLVVAACGGSTEPSNDVAIDVTSAARPVTSYAVRNRTTAAVNVKACAGQLATAATYTGQNVVHVLVCQQPTTTVTLAPGESRAGTVSIDAAGTYQLSITLDTGAGRVSGPFTVP